MMGIVMCGKLFKIYAWICFLIQLSLGYRLHTTCRKSKQIALTYDDGISYYTEDLLDILKDEGVKATFFILGETLSSELKSSFPRRLKSNTATLKRIIDEGHIVASHTFNHADLTTLSYDDIKWQVEATETAIHSIIKKRPRLLRPPYGSYNDNVMKILSDLGYIGITWDVDTNDWMHLWDDSAVMTELYNQVSDDLNPHIVLQHDTYPSSIDRQRDVISYFRDKGYKFVTMDECLGTTAYKK